MVCTSCLILYGVAAFIIYKVLDRLVRWPHVRGEVDKYILITGCDTGFGHEIAKRIDRRGCKVIAGCYTEKGETVLRKQSSGRLKTIRLDVADPESVKEAYATVKEYIPAGRGLWAILNNAGIAGKVGPVQWLTRADYDQVFNINLHGLIDMTTTFLPLIKQAKGRIVNTASVVGRVSIPGSAPYCISKFGVEAFSDSLRRELRMWKCPVITIEPGFHKTHITSEQYLTDMFKRSWEQISPELREEYGEEFYRKSIENVVAKAIDQISSPHIMDVVDAYEHALMAVFPRSRYHIGKDARYFWIPLSRLPDCLSDWILDKLARDKPIPAALKKNQ